MLAITSRRPDWARAEFLRLLNHQFADGHAVHTYFPEDQQDPARTIHSDDHLWLPKKLHPSFPSFPDVADAFSGYSLGSGENGAIFCHANAWAIIAECMLGRPERAWKYFRQLVPHLALQKCGLDRYQCEPYAYASSIIGPENPRFGLATLTHVTGTAAWMDIAGTQYLLGIRPVLDGLKFAPCLPPEWSHFTATRLYRGCQLDIAIAKPAGSIGNVCALTVDGKRHGGDTLRPEWLAGKKAARVEIEW